MKNYLNLYEKWMEDGESGFLCHTFQPFGPSSMDFRQNIVLFLAAMNGEL